MKLRLVLLFLVVGMQGEAAELRRYFPDKLVDVSKLTNSTPATAPLYWVQAAVEQSYPNMCVVKRPTEIRYQYSGPTILNSWEEPRLSAPSRTGLGGVVETPNVSQSQLRERQMKYQTIYLLSRQQGGLTEAEYFMIPASDRQFFQRTQIYERIAILNHTAQAGARVRVFGLPIGNVALPAQVAKCCQTAAQNKTTCRHKCCLEAGRKKSPCSTCGGRPEGTVKGFDVGRPYSGAPTNGWYLAEKWGLVKQTDWPKDLGRH